jgi:spore germination cell wall hydrolase CwlJ-like protein
MTKEILTVGMSLLLALVFATTTVPEAIAPGAAPTEEQTEQVPEKRYYLTVDERELICEVVMAESGTEPYAGKIAVSQCILNACEQTGKSPAEIVTEYGYTARRVKPSAEVEKAVSAVFDDGEAVTDAEILYFYAPELVSSEWHESQTYICTIGGHRFFA